MKSWCGNIQNHFAIEPSNWHSLITNAEHAKAFVMHLYYSPLRVVSTLSIASRYAQLCLSVPLQYHNRWVSPLRAAYALSIASRYTH